MRIAIASGKGGTGKTTIAVSLAHVAAKQGRAVAYLDCDVEEPNRISSSFRGFVAFALPSCYFTLVVFYTSGKW